MKITVITVAFNSASTIGDTLRSVAAQSYPLIEHVVIDGASTDDTLAIVRTHGATVKHLVSEPDDGIYDAMNKGLQLATGDFVGFLNADDSFADTNAVRHIAEAAFRPETDVVYGDLMYVRKDAPEQPVRYWRSGEFHPSRLRFGWMPPHPTLYVRRSRIQEIGAFEASFRIAADYEFTLRYLSWPGIKVVYVPEVLVRMRTGGASNRSLGALLKKSGEDLRALRQNNAGGIFTLMSKNLRKLPQFFIQPRVVDR
jgi:glycosyltransferase